MSEEIEVGEYVRNESGYIHKVKDEDELMNFFIDKDGKLKEIAGVDFWNEDIYENIIRHSKNIIDLIEEGDALEVEADNEIMIVAFSEDYMGFYEEIKDKVQQEEMKILSILTHEQYKANCYRLEE